MEQKIKSILDDNVNIFITNDSDEGLKSLNFYLSAIKNQNPYYRFLDAYYIFESFFYKYFRDYVKQLEDSKKDEEFYDEIGSYRNEQAMLKLVFKNCLDKIDIQSIKKFLLEINIQELAKNIGKSYNIKNWEEDDDEKFCSKFADLIYSFRNAIVHSKIEEQNIEKIKNNSELNGKFVSFCNKLLDIANDVLERNIKKW